MLHLKLGKGPLSLVNLDFALFFASTTVICPNIFRYWRWIPMKMFAPGSWIRYCFCGLAVFMFAVAALHLSGSTILSRTNESADWSKRLSEALSNDTSTSRHDPFHLHYIKFKPKNPGASTELRFVDYLSVQSALQNLQPDQIFVHGDFIPTGSYWNELHQNKLIQHRARKPASAVGTEEGRPKPLRWREHAADIAKLDVLLEYGGVAVDFDVFFVRGHRIKKILQTKKAIVCYGDSDAYNMGFIAGNNESKALRAWRRSYEDIYVPEWGFNQGVVPKYLSALFREEVYVLDQVCNNPHASQLEKYFDEHGTINWTDSIAIHSYERSGGTSIPSPDDLKGNLTTHKELLLSIYERKPLPSENLQFQDEIDPFTNKLVGD